MCPAQKPYSQQWTYGKCADLTTDCVKAFDKTMRHATGPQKMQHRIDNDKHKRNMLVQQRTALQNNQRLHFMRMARQLQSFAGNDFRTTESENWFLNL